MGLEDDSISAIRRKTISWGEHPIAERWLSGDTIVCHLLVANPARNNRILHIDGDSFFASCKMALNPSLEGRPVWMGGGRRGD